MLTQTTPPQAAPPPRAARSEQGLVHGICDQLQQLIYSGEIAPGERLNEAALALRMGTSRGPIREAIRMLAGIGLVLAVPNRGVFVRQISVREMLEIYELRAKPNSRRPGRSAMKTAPSSNSCWTPWTRPARPATVSTTTR